MTLQNRPQEREFPKIPADPSNVIKLTPTVINVNNFERECTVNVKNVFNEHMLVYKLKCSDNTAFEIHNCAGCLPPGDSGNVRIVGLTQPGPGHRFQIEYILVTTEACATLAQNPRRIWRRAEHQSAAHGVMMVPLAK